ncbi:4606_t:CDS:2, partial [Paraglomus brasilianum]
MSSELESQSAQSKINSLQKLNLKFLAEIFELRKENAEVKAENTKLKQDKEEINTRKCDTEKLTGGRDCFFKKIQQVNIPPSELADPRKFNRFQNEEDPLALNYHPAQLTGLPVTLCNDILAKFQDNANGSIELVEEDIKFVQNLSYEMCSIFQDEAERTNHFHKLAGEYLDK